ncbi:hypothetical protein [Peribacillus sp. NPDC056705]
MNSMGLLQKKETMRKVLINKYGIETMDHFTKNYTYKPETGKTIGKLGK